MGSPGAKSHCSIFVDISPQLSKFYPSSNSLTNYHCTITSFPTFLFCLNPKKLSTPTSRSAPVPSIHRHSHSHNKCPIYYTSIQDRNSLYLEAEATQTQRFRSYILLERLDTCLKGCVGGRAQVDAGER